jgi:mono/diheme cytochrome c family protein
MHRLALAAVVVWAMSGPQLDFVLNCQGCHRADGAGTPGSIPPLAGSVGRFLRVAGGREFLARVPGVAQAPLDDAALAAVLNWMLGQYGEPPADFVPYTATEVRSLRARPLVDVDTVRRALVEEMVR